MAAVECEQLRQSLPLNGLTATRRSTENDFLFIAAVPAEVNDMWLIEEQQPLQVDGSCGSVLEQFELVALATFDSVPPG